MRSLKPQSLSSYLARSGNRSQSLTEHGRLLQHLDGILRRLLPDGLASHCRVANIHGDTLVLAVDSPGWSSRARFHTPQLLQGLARRQAAVRNVRIIVVPASQTVRKEPRPPRTLSGKSSELLQNAAESVDDPALRAALLRLSSRGKSGGSSSET